MDCHFRWSSKTRAIRDLIHVFWFMWAFGVSQGLIRYASICFFVFWELNTLWFCRWLPATLLKNAPILIFELQCRSCYWIFSLNLTRLTKLDWMVTLWPIIDVVLALWLVFKLIYIHFIILIAMIILLDLYLARISIEKQLSVVFKIGVYNQSKPILELSYCNCLYLYLAI